MFKSDSRVEYLYVFVWQLVELSKLNSLDTLKEWRDIEGHKIFASKLRFQIRLDDFRWDNRNTI